jgi:cytochrome P450
MTASMEPPRLGWDFIADPYSAYARLRSDQPVTRVTMPGGELIWLVTRYADVRAALTDPRLCKDPRRVAGNGPIQLAPLDLHLLNVDPPEHDRLRRLIAREFTPSRIERLRPRVMELTSSLLDGMDGLPEADLVAQFALPLPVTVICELLGIPGGDQDLFRSWSAAVMSFGDEPEKFGAAAAAITAYITDLVAAKRDEPSDDLLSALVSMRDSQDRLSESELLAMTFLLLVAGHETTANLISSGMLALLMAPAQLDQLRADRSLLPSAVEELLRFDGPATQAHVRYSTEPIEIGGVLIPIAQPVVMAFGSANRDPSRYHAPDDLDVRRDASGHLGFGYGIHYCLGAPLARLEAAIAIGGLLERFPGMTLAVRPDELRWRPTLLRGLEQLPVRLR